MALHLETRCNALWTFFGSWLLLTVIAALAGGIIAGPVGVHQLFQVFINNVPNPSGSSLGTILNICGNCFLLFFACFVFRFFLKLSHMNLNHTVHERTRSVVYETFKPLQQIISSRHFTYFNFFVLAGIEEIVCRWLFVGILPQHLDIPFAFLLIAGNVGWLWFQQHFFNQRQTILLSSIQLLCSLMHTLVFFQYGIGASYLSNLAVRSIFLSFHKIENVEDKDLYMGLVSLLHMSLSIAYLSFMTGVSPGEGFNYFISWINGGDVFIEGWNFFDYLALSSMVIYFAKAVNVFLLYDQGIVSKPEVREEYPFFGFILLAILTIITSLFAGLMTVNMQTKALVFTLILSLFYHADSGSGRVRNFWMSLITIFMLTCIAYRSSPYGFAFYLAANVILYLPFMLLERMPCQKL